MLWYLISLVAFKTIDWFIFRILVDGYNDNLFIGFIQLKYKLSV